MLENSISLLEIAMRGDYNHISERIPQHTQQLFRLHGLKAIEIWHSTMKILAKAQLETGVPFRFKCGVRRYAIDSIVIAKSLRPKADIRDSSFQLFLIFYLSVHMLDDIVEDTCKFHAKISYNKNMSDMARKNIAVANYPMLAVKTAMIIMDENEVYSADEKNAIMKIFVDQLINYAKYFSLEKQKTSVVRALEIKEHGVSGMATEVIFDFLLLQKYISNPKIPHFRKGLFYLGSLTQFIDDLRDYEEDRINGNSNILITLKKEYKEDARNKFVEYYLKEERMMLAEFKKSGKTLDYQAIMMLPWYRFFIDKV